MKKIIFLILSTIIIGVGIGKVVLFNSSIETKENAKEITSKQEQIIDDEKKEKKTEETKKSEQTEKEEKTEQVSKSDSKNQSTTEPRTTTSNTSSVSKKETKNNNSTTSTQPKTNSSTESSKPNTNSQNNNSNISSNSNQNTPTTDTPKKNNVSTSFYDSITHGKKEFSSESAAFARGTEIQNKELDYVLDWNEKHPDNQIQPDINYFRVYPVIDDEGTGYYLHFFCRSGEGNDDTLKSKF